jgi:predicted RNA-binding Zn ribbon-like protein
METTFPATGVPRELPIVGGHLALDFANTVDDPEGMARYDHAGTFPELVAWSVRLGILQTDEATTLLASGMDHPRARSAALKRAHALRGILIETFSTAATINSGEVGKAAAGAVLDAQWHDLRSYVTDAMAHSELVSHDHKYQLDWPVITRLDSMLWPIAMAAVQLLTSPQIARVKKCAGCPWVFLDQSKNLSRRWCAMQDCGTHEKIVRYVARRAARKRA